MKILKYALGLLMLVIANIAFAQTPVNHAKSGSYANYVGKYICTANKENFYYFEKQDSSSFRLVNQLATSLTVTKIDDKTGQIDIINEEAEQMNFGWFSKRKDGHYDLKVRLGDGGVSTYRFEVPEKDESSGE
jgi:hypothetical protein